MDTEISLALTEAERRQVSALRTLMAKRDEQYSQCQRKDGDVVDQEAFDEAQADYEFQLRAEGYTDDLLDIIDRLAGMGTYTMCIAPDDSNVDFGNPIYVVTAADWDTALRLVADDLLDFVNENLAKEGNATWENVFGVDESDPYFNVEFSFYGAPAPVQHDWQRDHRGDWQDPRVFLPAIAATEETAA